LIEILVDLFYIAIITQIFILSRKNTIFSLGQKYSNYDILGHMKKGFDYRGAMILGMHDAIVSLTGLIAGLGLAFSDKDVIILSCIISSITASLSMGAANYLAVKATNREHALCAALYTASAYMLTCVILILPFFVFINRTTALLSVGGLVILIIYLFNFIFFRHNRFYKHFYEMLGICLSVSLIAFFIGFAAKYFLGI